MKRDKRSAYGGPAEERELVITLDRRLLYVVMLIGAFGLAVGGGYLVSRSTPRAAGEAVPTAAVPAARGVPEVDEAAARATAQALGLPTTVVIVTPNVAEIVRGTPVPGAEPGSIRFLEPDERARVTPVDDLHGELLTDEGATVFEVNPDPERYKQHDVLANTVDPNVDNSEYRPLRLETVSKPIDGPRLAISDLNLNYTYDFGIIGMTDRVSHAFTARNVGTEDLVIGRVYTGCGCTATTIGGAAIPPDGILPQPLTLRPGEEITFTVEFDAQSEGRTGAMAKYVQIFSNDPSHTRFQDDDPRSHETRFRIVVEPQY